MVTYTNRSTRFPHENLFVPCCLTTNYPCLRTNQCHQLCKKKATIYTLYLTYYLAAHLETHFLDAKHSFSFSTMSQNENFCSVFSKGFFKW